MIKILLSIHIIIYRNCSNSFFRRDNRNKGSSRLDSLFHFFYSRNGACINFDCQNRFRYSVQDYTYYNDLQNPIKYSRNICNKTERKKHLIGY